MEVWSLTKVRMSAPGDQAARHVTSQSASNPIAYLEYIDSFNSTFLIGVEILVSFLWF